MRLVVQSTPQPGLLTGELVDPETGAVFARLTDVSVGDDPECWALACNGTPRVILTSGVHASHEDDPGAWLTSWSEKGWAAFDGQAGVASNAAKERGVELLLRPDAKGMLSDAVSTLSWCTRGGGQRQSLLLDPIGWLVPSMLRDLDDHLIRLNELSEAMISHGRVACVLLRSLRRGTDDQLIPASLRAGDLDATLLRKRLGRLIEHAPAGAVLDKRDWALFS